MKSNWIKKPLSKVVMFKNGKKRPKDFGNIPVYGGNGILGYADNSNYENCIIIGRVGAYCGSVCYENNKCWVSDNAIAAQPIGENNIIFIYYLLKNLQLNNRHIGTSQPLLTQEILNRIECAIPPVEEQNRIASIINLIDEKIQNNIQINDNLLQQLQAIYRMTFGKHSQYNAPKGQLSDICSYSQRRIAVSSLSTESYYSTENMLPKKAGAVVATSLPDLVQTTGCMPGDILVSNIRPYFKKIVYCQSECGCSTDVLCFVPKTQDLSLYIYSTLYDDFFFDYMVAGSKGTKMPRGDKKQIMAYPIILPSATQLAKFNASAQPILAKINTNKQENKRLSSMQEILLPKLMSGEIDVSNISC